MNIPLFVIVLVWLGQIAVLSFVGPISNRLRIVSLLKLYPPSKYPRLYPFSINLALTKLRLSVWLNGAAGMLSLIILVYLLGQDTPEQKLISAMAITFCSQIVVSIYTLVSRRWKLAKTFQNIDPPTIRMAELQPRKLTNYVSPFSLGVYAILFVSAICIWAIAIARASEYPQVLFRSFFMLVCIGTLFLNVIAIKKRLSSIRVDISESFRDAFRRLRNRLMVSIYSGYFVFLLYGLLGLIFAGLLPKTNATLVLIIDSLAIQALVLIVHWRNWREIGQIDADGYRASIESYQQTGKILS